MNEKIFLENAHHVKCPICHNPIAIENNESMIVRQSTFILFDKYAKKIKAKCRHCKNLIDI
jgi:hypothetical protein